MTSRYATFDVRRRRARARAGAPRRDMALDDDALVALRRACARVSTSRDALDAASGDMGAHARARPDAVATPTTTAEAAALVRECARRRIAVVPRGAGTGLEGGCVAHAGGVVVDTLSLIHI